MVFTTQLPECSVVLHSVSEEVLVRAEIDPKCLVHFMMIGLDVSLLSTSILAVHVSEYLALGFLRIV